MHVPGSLLYAWGQAHQTHEFCPFPISGGQLLANERQPSGREEGDSTKCRAASPRLIKMHRVASSLFFGALSIGRLGPAHAFTTSPCPPEFSSRSGRDDITSRATAAALVDGLDENVDIIKSLEEGLADPSDPAARSATSDESPPQCADIARDLDGEPLSPEYLSTVLGVRVDSYECPESDAFRGLMSNGCRIRTQPGGDTAFYKRIEFASLKHARDKLKVAPEKLKRDVKSYEVVTSFLSSRACQEVIDGADVHIPKCLDVNMMPNHEDPIRSQFSIMLEDFSVEKGWTQRWLLDDEDEVKASLGMFARLHAFFWQGSSFWENGEAADEFERGVWPSAGYSQPKLQSPDQWKEVARGWEEHKLQCKSDLEHTSYWSNLGDRLQESVAEQVGHLAHPFANETLRVEYSKYRTFTHGDPKQSNVSLGGFVFILEADLINGVAAFLSGRRRRFASRVDRFSVGR